MAFQEYPGALFYLCYDCLLCLQVPNRYEASLADVYKRQVVDSLIALDGGGQAGGDQQGAQGTGGEQEREGASKHDHVLSDGGTQSAFRVG